MRAARPVGVRLKLDKPAAVKAEDLERRELLGGGRDQDGRTRIDEQLRREVDPLLAPGQDHYAFRGCVDPELAELLGDLGSQSRVALGWTVLKRASRYASRPVGSISLAGSPPANEIIPGRSITLRISRIGDGLNASVRSENKDSSQRGTDGGTVPNGLAAT